MLDSWSGPLNPQEPDIVARLVLQGTPKFHYALSKFPTIWTNVASVGVFSHQSPMVEYHDGANIKRCELGDILICHFHTNAYGQVSRNAMLFQTKISNNISLNINQNDTQLKLYSEWPTYTYYRSGQLNGQIRSLKPSQAHQGAQYMIIHNADPRISKFKNSPYINPYSIGATTVSPQLYADLPLEIQLINFFFGITGRSFDSYFNRNSSDEWTKIIWDLLLNSINRSFNRRRAGFHNSPRMSRNSTNMDGMMNFIGTHDFLSNAMSSDFINNFEGTFTTNNNDKSDTIYTPTDFETGGAPSVIVIITNTMG